MLNLHIFLLITWKVKIIRKFGSHLCWKYETIHTQCKEKEEMGISRTSLNIITSFASLFRRRWMEWFNRWFILILIIKGFRKPKCCFKFTKFAFKTIKIISGRWTTITIIEKPFWKQTTNTLFHSWWGRR